MLCVKDILSGYVGANDAIYKGTPDIEVLFYGTGNCGGSIQVRRRIGMPLTTAHAEFTGTGSFYFWTRRDNDVSIGTVRRRASDLPNGIYPSGFGYRTVDFVYGGQIVMKIDGEDIAVAGDVACGLDRSRVQAGIIEY